MCLLEVFMYLLPPGEKLFCTTSTDIFLLKYFNIMLKYESQYVMNHCILHDPDKLMFLKKSYSYSFGISFDDTEKTMVTPCM